jgi:pimeloyl-ACP methyl ester carboxylesterase
MDSPAAYTPRRPGTDRFVPARGLDHHVITWGDPGLVTSERPALFMVHGWMDVGASFQFVVDALAALEGDARYILAADWRGFGLTRVPPTDSYWFADYLGDLDALLHHPALGLATDAPVDLLGHSMGGNVVMSYAGVRPERIRRLVNLEGFGLPEMKPHHAPRRLRQWLDELRGVAGTALVGAACRWPLAHPGRPGAQAHQPGPLPQGRDPRNLEADQCTAAVG